jgi:hypothetical protein
MGFLDSLLGRTKPVTANLDALFALPSAAVTLETSAGLALSGTAGICWKPPAGKSVEDLQREISELLAIDDGPAESPTGPESPVGQAPPPGPVPEAGDPGAGRASGGPLGPLTQNEDSYGYRWLLLDDPDPEDLVTRVHLVNSTLSDNGWGPQLLCSVFGVKPAADAGPDAHPFFLVYLFKRGTFYPFAPTGKDQRDTEFELRIRGVLGSDLPVEADLSRWFPLWDLPVANT